MKHFNSKHDLTKTRVHVIWRNIKYRCLSPSSPNFKNYGAKGITISKRWLDFENFLKDMGYPPTSSHSIDRKNGKKGYTKSNCRWATPVEQASNRKSNAFITFGGETLTKSDWARKMGMSYSTFLGRLRSGWTMKRTLTQKIQTHKLGVK